MRPTNRAQFTAVQHRDPKRGRGLQGSITSTRAPRRERLGVAVLGPTGSFPAVEDPRTVDPSVQLGWLHNIATMCTSGDLLQASMQFQKPRPVGDVRSSPWLRCVPFLHTVESARERLRSWCERAWDAL